MTDEPLVPLTKRQQDDLRLINDALSSCHSIFGLEALARIVGDLKRAASSAANAKAGAFVKNANILKALKPMPEIFK